MTRRLPVYNINVAHELTKRGFVLDEIRINKKNPKYYVYLFQEKEGIREALKAIVASL